jgi:hypothetical protein
MTRELGYWHEAFGLFASGSAHRQFYALSGA